MAILTKQTPKKPPNHITVKSYSAKNSLNMSNNFYQRLSKSKFNKVNHLSAKKLRLRGNNLDIEPHPSSLSEYEKVMERTGKGLSLPALKISTPLT